MPKKVATKVAAPAPVAPVKKKPVAKPVTKAAAVSTRKPAAKKTKASARPVRATRGAHATCKVMSDPNESFWVNYGPIVTTLDELADALRVMTDEQYLYHVPGDRNDFARWVGESLACEVCASKLEKAKTRTAAIQAIESCRK